jgi:hypothetical protein
VGVEAGLEAPSSVVFLPVAGERDHREVSKGGEGAGPPGELEAVEAVYRSAGRGVDTVEEVLERFSDAGLRDQGAGCRGPYQGEGAYLADSGFRPTRLLFGCAGRTSPAGARPARRPVGRPRMTSPRPSAMAAGHPPPLDQQRAPAARGPSALEGLDERRARSSSGRAGGRRRPRASARPRRRAREACAPTRAALAPRPGRAPPAAEARAPRAEPSALVRRLLCRPA